MDPDTLEQAFSPFFSTRTGEGGWGIGLAASRAIIEGLGGTIAIESSVGVGTTVRLLIPGAPEGPDEV
jgi:signal transduction histidine kinase